MGHAKGDARNSRGDGCDALLQARTNKSSRGLSVEALGLTGESHQAAKQVASRSSAKAKHPDAANVTMPDLTAKLGWGKDVV
eukprot:4010762-Amphidinium_carterae.2